MDAEHGAHADLGVGGAEGLGDLEPALKGVLGRQIVGCGGTARASDLELDMRNAGFEAFEQPLGAVKPPVRDRRRAARAQVLDHQPQRCASGCRVVAEPAVLGVGALAEVDALRDAPLQPADLPEPVERRRAVVLILERALVCARGDVPLGRLEGGTRLGEGSNHNVTLTGGSTRRGPGVRLVISPVSTRSR